MPVSYTHLDVYKRQEYDIKLSIIPDADHSLETADTMKNIAIINKVMDEIKKYL